MNYWDHTSCKESSRFTSEHPCPVLSLYMYITAYIEHTKLNTLMETKVFTIIVFFIYICLASALERNFELQPSYTQQKISDPNSFETYIIHVSSKTFLDNVKPQDKEPLYHSFLPKTTSGLPDKTRVVYSYRNVLNGFAAKLTDQEVKAMEKMDGFLYARTQRILDLHTTHTPTFLGLHQNLGTWPTSNFGTGTIIGLFDSGITPSHPSFDDKDMPPPPAKWKGKCEFDAGLCNNKLIGARNYGSPKPEPPIDNFGHGTHTSSTAAGNYIQNASVFGLASGTAVGMAPRAHVAMYKVCDDYNGCTDTNILAAMDDAIEDGVDIFSLSLGGRPLAFYNESIAVGAFAAMRKGILVSCSAGNAGPDSSSLSNEAPWILTVGAGTIDREVRASALLGDDLEYVGQSLYQPTNFSKTLFPLIFPGSNGIQNASYCVPESLKNIDLKGKIVVCESGGVFTDEKAEYIKNSSGAGFIAINPVFSGYTTTASYDEIPTAHVSFQAGEKIKSYVKSTSKPTGTLVFDGTVIGLTDAPRVSAFSSRGPSVASPGILKPDIFGPGVNILAAWPFAIDDKSHTRRELTYNIISGTSMSCPHLAGIAALIKSEHPDWSPAAIKSAIMTTADTRDRSGKDPILDEHDLFVADVFALGAGHVNPSKAIEPGLVYDIHPDDYIPYLCGLGYTDSQIQILLQSAIKCSTIKSIVEAELNYPSFAVYLGSKNLTFTRTLTNVGESNSVYEVKIYDIPRVEVLVEPTKLEFTKFNQSLTYSITFSARYPADTFVEGAIAWISSKYSVRSPISVKLSS